MKKNLIVRILLSICLVVLVIAPLSSGCKAKVSEVSGEKVTFRGGLENMPRTMNPFLARSTVDMIGVTLVYEPLILRKVDGRIFPCLAKSWEYDAPNITWTLHLNEKAKFSDGTPVTAEDVKFTYDTTYKFNFNAAAITKAYVESITVVDSTTIKFKLNTQRAMFFADLATILIVPKHVWDSIADPGAEMNPKPVGSGPFFWDEIVADSHVRFSKNPNYWNGAASIDEVIFKYYGTAESQLIALRSGDLDTVGNLRMNSAVPILMQDPNFSITLSKTAQTELLRFNLRIQPWNILEFRKAVNIVIDRGSIINHAYSGYGDIPYQAIMAPCIADANPAVKWPYEFKTQAERTAMANTILNTIPGMSAIGTDGLREYTWTENNITKKKKLSFEYLVDATPESIQTTEILLDNVKSIGIKINPVTTDSLTIYAKMLRHNGTAPLGWELATYGTPGVSLDGLANQWCGAPFSWGKSCDANGWKNQTVQALLIQTQTEMDLEKRSKIGLEAQVKFAEDVPIICLMHPIGAAVHRADTFTGWLQDFSGYAYNGSVPLSLSMVNLLSLRPVSVKK